MLKQRALVPSPIAPPRARRGLSLRPSDAVNPYTLGRLAPDRAGIDQLAVFCTRCDHALIVTELTMTEAGLLIEGVCDTCPDRGGEGTGIYRRYLIPLQFGTLPQVT